MSPSGWTQTNTSDIWETNGGCMLSTAALCLVVGFGATPRAVKPWLPEESKATYCQAVCNPCGPSWVRLPRGFLWGGRQLLARRLQMPSDTVQGKQNGNSVTAAVVMIECLQGRSFS